MIQAINHAIYDPQIATFYGLKNEPFNKQTTSVHLDRELVHFSDPRCISIENSEKFKNWRYL